MIRTVLLPFGKGGIIGGTMLGLGRALGETIAALMILSIAFDVKIRILELGGTTTSVLIASRFGDATSFQLSCAAGGRSGAVPDHPGGQHVGVDGGHAFA